jgi:hypothetical protein
MKVAEVVSRLRNPHARVEGFFLTLYLNIGPEKLPGELFQSQERAQNF